VAGGARWIDLLDPTREQLLAALPYLDPDDIEVLAAGSVGEQREPRPLLESSSTYVIGVFVDALPDAPEGRTSYREVDVVATAEQVVTVRKTPPDGAPPWEPACMHPAITVGASAGELVYRIVDDIAESYLDVIDAAYPQIDELEDHIDDWPSDRLRRELTLLRHDLLHARRLVGATRGAVRRVVDRRVDIGHDELFTEPVERSFANTYETLFRAAEELDVARELLSSARDYHQSVIAEAQANIGKKLTVIASLLLLPTLIVGFYGQNFAGNFRDWYWTIGISTFLIVATTVLQLALFKWRRWI
jgi:Mg2+ and Co2+ transporter CorA